MLIRIFTFIVFMATTGCVLMKTKPNYLPKGVFEFNAITRDVSSVVDEARFRIIFSSNVDYRIYGVVYQFACLLKNDGVISNKDFDNAHAVSPKDPSIMFFLQNSLIEEKNNQFTYSIIGSYREGFPRSGESAPKAYTNYFMRENIPDVGVTCAFYHSYPLTQKKRFISNPVIIPKADFIRILQ